MNKGFTILRAELDFTNEAVVTNVPKVSEIVDIGMQNGKVNVWFKVPVHGSLMPSIPAPEECRKMKIFPTGDFIPGNFTYLGSARDHKMNQYFYIWHVCEEDGGGLQWKRWENNP